MAVTHGFRTKAVSTRQNPLYDIRTPHHQHTRTTGGVSPRLEHPAASTYPQQRSLSLNKEIIGPGVSLVKPTMFVVVKDGWLVATELDVIALGVQESIEDLLVVIVKNCNHHIRCTERVKVARFNETLNVDYTWAASAGVGRKLRISA